MAIKRENRKSFMTKLHQKDEGSLTGPVPYKHLTGCKHKAYIAQSIPVRSPTQGKIREMPINISKWALAAWHPSVPTCYRVLLAGTLYPLPFPQLLFPV